MMIWTIIAPYIISPCVYGLSIYGGVAPTTFDVIWGGLFLWLFTGSPLAVSLLIAIKMRYIVPSLILLFSTVVYGLWYVFCWFAAMNGGSCMAGMSVVCMVPFSLPWMILVWGLAVSANSSYVKEANSESVFAQNEEKDDTI